MSEAEANAAALGGRAADALRIYSSLLNNAALAGPERARLLAARADTQLSLDLARRALKDADAALAIDPRYAPALLAKGMALEAEGRVEEARGIYLYGTLLPEPLVVLRLFQNALNAINKPAAAPTPVPVPAPAPAPAPAPVAQIVRAVPQATTIPAQSLVPSTPVAVPAMASPTTPDPEPQLMIGPGKVAAPLKMEDVTALQNVLTRTGSGDSIDEKVALGYVHVNRGQLGSAITLFSSLLATAPKCVGALLGRGTAYALQQDLDKADADFSAAILADPNSSDAWKRRGQVRCVAASTPCPPLHLHSNTVWLPVI